MYRWTHMNGSYYLQDEAGSVHAMTREPAVVFGRTASGEWHALEHGDLDFAQAEMGRLLARESRMGASALYVDSIIIASPAWDVDILNRLHECSGFADEWVREHLPDLPPQPHAFDPTPLTGAPDRDPPDHLAVGWLGLLEGPGF